MKFGWLTLFQAIAIVVFLTAYIRLTFAERKISGFAILILFMILIEVVNLVIFYLGWQGYYTIIWH